MPFKTSFGVETKKVAVITTVRSDGVEGYGEGVMDVLPLYREETIAGALGLMRDALVPDLLQHGCEHPADLYDRWSGWRGNPMAKTALELAVWDCFARQQGVPLATLLGGERTEIPVGASLGMNPVPETVASVDRHVAEGYRRVKLKIEPGWDRAMLEAVRAASPDIELTVDANSAYTLDDTALLRSFDEFDLHYIEQPLHWDDLVDHAALAPLLAHADLPRRVAHVAGAGACRARPGRVHGRQRQGRSLRRADGGAACARAVRRPRRADVVWRDARDRHRSRAQHPPRHDARLRLPGRHGVGQPHLPPRHHRAAARGDQRHHARPGRARASASRSTARSSTRSPRTCDVLRR